MCECVSWLNQWVETDRGRTIAAEQFGKAFSGVSSCQMRILYSFVGFEPFSAPFFVKLLRDTSLYALELFPRCGERTAMRLFHAVLHFRLLLVEAYTGEMADLASYVLKNESQDKWLVQVSNIQQLRSVIEDLCDQLSVRSFRIVRRLFRSLDYDVQRLYAYISHPDFDCRDIPLVGDKTYPEIKNWCDSVILRVNLAYTPARAS